MPVRIYEKEEMNLIVIAADIPIHPLASYEVGKELVTWAESIKVKELVCLAGITVMADQHRVFGAVSMQSLLERIKDKAEIFELGTITGISGSIMNECRSKNIPAICLLGETASAAPDPRAAVATLDTLNKMYNLGVDTAKLGEKASEIETQMQQLAEQVKTATPAELPKEFPMYG